MLFRSCDGQVRNSLPETNEPPDREAKKRKSLDAAKEAMQQCNRHNQLLLSDESIIVLTIMKHVAEVSDEKFLLLQHLMHLLYVGAPLTKQEAAQLTIGGDSLVNRARQLKWALNQQAVQKINNAPGVKSLAGDDTEIDSANCGSRCMGTSTKIQMHRLLILYLVLPRVARRRTQERVRLSARAKKTPSAQMLFCRVFGQRPKRQELNIRSR